MSFLLNTIRNTFCKIVGNVSGILRIFDLAACYHILGNIDQGNLEIIQS